MKGNQNRHPGWLIVMPDGHIHSWHVHNSDCPDAEAAMAWFAPHPAREADLIRRGWAVRAGAATELITPVPARASA
jgi:uncharacterized protein